MTLESAPVQAVTSDSAYIGSPRRWPACRPLGSLWPFRSLWSFWSLCAVFSVFSNADEVMSGMLFIWAGGSVLGPILTGAVADTQAGQPGVFPAVALGYFGLMAANLGRLFIRSRPTGSQRSPFQPLQATSLVQGKVVEEAECAAQAGDAPPSAPASEPKPV